jgi:hypothetical protein
MSMPSSALLRVAPAIFVFLWSTGWIVARSVAPYAEPLTFLSVRFALAAAVLLAFAWASGARWPRTAAELAHMVLSGILAVAFYFAGVWYAVAHGVPAGVSGLIASIQPLLTAILASAFLGERVSRLQWIGIAEKNHNRGLYVAEKIGADPLLTRVGAQFHDIGKALNPTFFIENQIPGNVNTHHDIPPEESAATIIRHITDGVQLARKYRLPGRLHDFILEHHGTLITRYQYNQAMEAAGGDVTKVDIEKFRYPGPRPNSRETALLMLADATEARARAERPVDDDGLRALVRSVIETVQRYSQLDDTLLTLRDLHLITESFVTTLRGTYHPRIQYPNAKVPDPETTLVNSRKE